MQAERESLQVKTVELRLQKFKLQANGFPAMDSNPSLRIHQVVVKQNPHRRASTRAADDRERVTLTQPDRIRIVVVPLEG